VSAYKQLDDNLLRSHLIAHNLDVSIKRGETNESKISRLTALAATKESERHGVSFRNKLPELCDDPGGRRSHGRRHGAPRRRSLGEQTFEAFIF